MHKHTSCKSIGFTYICKCTLSSTCTGIMIEMHKIFSLLVVHQTCLKYYNEYRQISETWLLKKRHCPKTIFLNPFWVFCHSAWLKQHLTTMQTFVAISYSGKNQSADCVWLMNQLCTRAFLTGFDCYFDHPEQYKIMLLPVILTCKCTYSRFDIVDIQYVHGYKNVDRIFNNF